HAQGGTSSLPARSAKNSSAHKHGPVLRNAAWPVARCITEYSLRRSARWGLPVLQCDQVVVVALGAAAFRFVAGFFAAAVFALVDFVADLVAPVFFAAALGAAVFFAAPVFALVDFVAGLVVAAFLVAAFFAVAFGAAVFFAAPVFALVDFVAGFFAAGFLVAAFFVVAFFAAVVFVAISVGSCRNRFGYGGTRC
ncbi:MAG: hypothetical protein KDA79_20980, partial [Planctomycetaceae bacterium]|nr:hypothetical protein [Planctomycetaceae bacterium]